MKSITYLHEGYQNHKSRNALIHLIFFAAIIPIFFINGFRFWAASWIFFMGAYHVVLYRDWKYLILSISAIFLHWSFLSANAVLIIYFLVGNRNRIYYLLLVISFIIPQLLTAYLPQISEALTEGLQGRVGLYTDPELIKKQGQSLAQARWFMTWVNLLVLYYIYFAILYIRVNYKGVMNNPLMNNLFSFILLFLSFANFSGTIGSGSRFHTVFMLFGIMYIFYFFVTRPFVKLHLLSYVALVPLVLYVGLTFRQYSDTISFWILGPSPLALFAPELSIGNILFGL